MKKTLRAIPLLITLYLLCTQETVFSQAVVQTGKSYVNITKGLTGGTIEPGDTLEIRATIAVGNWDGSSITKVRFNDTIPANTTYIPGTIKILTNEGLTFRAYTDAGGDDAGMYDGTTSPQPTVRINMGSSVNGTEGGVCSSTGTATTNGGTIKYNGRPSFYGGVCIMCASYRIVVSSSLSYGDVVNMYGGAFRYSDGGSSIISAFTAYTVAISENLGLCANSIGANAIIDNGGTFGSGDTQNRGDTSAIVPGYSLQNISGNQPNDGSYAIVNNLSPSGTTDTTTANPDNSSPSNRVFGLWDIIGDHTNAADSAAGNPPVAPGDTGGYFVAVNASYANSNAVQQTVGGLCPNTYYEFSAWLRNICKYCACDSAGNAPYRTSGGVKVPNSSFLGVDSSGVNPNLTFTIDGVDYYTTGTMTYTGEWVKKGFVLLTGPSQTSFTLTIRNNAAGGGGNDWAIDDVTLATCTPNLDLKPSPSVAVCSGNTVDMSCDVRSYFPNYTSWQWEKSTDGGITWSNTGVNGTGTPDTVAGEYQYTATYPTFIADSADDNNMYRVRVASTSGNLNDTSCSFTATTTISLMVSGCTPLNTRLVDFAGRKANDLATLYWSVENESPEVQYELQSSDDNDHFKTIGLISGGALNSGNTPYSVTDSRPLTGPRYYRLKLTEGVRYAYSKIVLLSSDQVDFAIKSLINPFHNYIRFDLTTPSAGPVNVKLLDTYGRLVYRSKQEMQGGVNTIEIQGLRQLANGAYILYVEGQGQVVTKRLIKN